MPIGALVLLPERLGEGYQRGTIQRTVRHCNGQFKRLALVVQVRSSTQAHVRRAKTVRGELRHGFSGHAIPGSVEFMRIDLAQQAAPGARVMMLDISIKQAERREQTGRGRYDNALHLQGFRHPSGEQRTVAAKGEQRIGPRVTAAFGGDSTDGPHHIRGGDLVGAIRGMGQRQAKWRSDFFCKHLLRLLSVQPYSPTDQVR